MDLDPTGASGLEIYRILVGAIAPRPIAWVSTLSRDGQPNLAPFSFFTVASVVPPVLCFAPLLKAPAGAKDTLVNIRETGEFVVNVVTRALAEAMNRTSAAYGQGVDEFVMAGVDARPSHVVRPPGVAASPARFECRLLQLVALGDAPLAGHLVLGTVCHIHIAPAVWVDGRIDGTRLDAVGRLGGDLYATTRDTFAQRRPTTVD